jgi:hypothetical protein
MDIVIMDGSAYATLSAVVLGGVIRARPYRCDHVRIRGRAMMTNTPPNGAFGFGAPDAVRRRSALDRIVVVSVDRCSCAKSARSSRRPPQPAEARQGHGALPVLREARQAIAVQASGASGRSTNKGIGLSLFFHGSRFTAAE